MFTSDIIWGLDIGDSCIKAVKLKKSGDGFEILDYDYLELDIQLKEQEGYLPVVQNALNELFSRKTFAKTELCISISSKNINSKFISLAIEDKAKAMHASIVEEAANQIPFPLDKVEWDYLRLPDRDDEAQVALFAVRSEHVEQMLNLIDTNKIKVRGVQMPSLALYNYIATFGELEETTVVLDFGEKTSEIILLHDGGVWIRSLPLSGQHITELLEKKFRLSRKEANKLKRDMEKRPQKDKLFRVIEPKLKQLVGEIKRSLNFRRTQVKDLRPKYFLALGGSSQLPGVGEYFCEELGLKPFKLDPGSRLRYSCANPDRIRKAQGSFSAAIGLALQGFGEVPAKVNLLPKQAFLEQFFREKRPYVAVANMALLLGVLLAHISGSVTLNKLKEASSELKKDVNKIKSSIQQYDARCNDLKAPKDEVVFLLNATRGRDYAAEIYRSIKEAISSAPDVFVTGVEMTPVTPAQFMSDTKEEVKEETNNRGRRSSARPTVRAQDLPPMISLELRATEAQTATALVQSLKSMPLFQHSAGNQLIEERGSPTAYSYAYTQGVDIKDDEPTWENAEHVTKLREEKNWHKFAKGQKVLKEFNWYRMSLRLPVNIAVLNQQRLEGAE